MDMGNSMNKFKEAGFGVLRGFRASEWRAGFVAIGFALVCSSMIASATEAGEKPSTVAEGKDRTVIVAYSSDFTGYSTLGQLIAESDIVVIGQAATGTKLEDHSDAENVTMLQMFEVENAILGVAPSSAIGLVSYGANYDNDEITMVLSGGGHITLPLGGFGGLPTDARYLVFLKQLPARKHEGTPDATYEVVGSLSQGSFSISIDNKVRRYEVVDVVSPAGHRIHAMENVGIELEKVPGLTDFTNQTTLTNITARIKQGGKQFRRKADHELNHNVEITYSTPGNALQVHLTNGAANTDVYVGICGEANSGLDSCMLDTFRMVALDNNGRGKLTIASANRDSFLNECNGPCRIVVTNRDKRYAEIIIER